MAKDWREVDNDALHEMFAKGKQEGIDTRGIADHGFLHSIYFRDPNGYVIELAARTGKGEGESPDAAQSAAHRALEDWQSGKPGD